MNILPKKNWHVRKKENIARVRRDEAEAAEKIKEEERRAKLAEQEARLAFLRQRAKETFHIEGKGPDVPENVEEVGHINFFLDEEKGLQKSGTNKEYEEEKRKEKEVYEKKIGLLTYLGQDTLEAKGGKEWYQDINHFIAGQKKNNSSVYDEEEVGLKGKMKLDPIRNILKYTELKMSSQDKNKMSAGNKTASSIKNSRPHKQHRKKSKSRKRKYSESDNSESSAAYCQHKKRRTKKCKHQRSKKKYSSDSTSENDDLKKESMLAKMREERLKREEIERKRAERLLAGEDPNKEPAPIKNPVQYKQKYNSQFNPHLAKQNKVENVLQPGVKYWLK